MLRDVSLLLNVFSAHILSVGHNLNIKLYLGKPFLFHTAGALFAYAISGTKSHRLRVYR